MFGIAKYLRKKNAIKFPPPKSRSPNLTFVFSSYFTCIKIYFNNEKNSRNKFSSKRSKLPFAVLIEHFSKV